MDQSVQFHDAMLKAYYANGRLFWASLAMIVEANRVWFATFQLSRAQRAIEEVRPSHLGEHEVIFLKNLK